MNLQDYIDKMFISIIVICMIVACVSVGLILIIG
nr:MAG TPA: hypothetical protein [Caudoviricetes sp.]DAM38305.1 MAG TPA: hypothetical protein [Caudoviricetes sp.]